jgi:hypothetical protein
MSETGAGDIVLDLDKTRIKDILKEAHKGCVDLLGTDFNLTPEEFASQIDIYLDSNRVSIPVLIPLPSRKYPELKIEVNLRRKKVFARMASKSKQALLNYFLKTL